jgi:acyl-CoA oxidase
MKERFMLEISRDPVMQLKDVHDLTKDELRERTMQKIAEMSHYLKTDDAKTFARRCQVSVTMGRVTELETDEYMRKRS